MAKRLNSIDILRGISVILMIFGHVFYAWPIVNNIFLINLFIFIFLLAPPLFLIISGFSFYLFVNNMKMNSYSKKKIFIEILKRALFISIVTTMFILIFGFIYNLKISFIIYWSIFQVISLSMILFWSIIFIRQIYRLICYLFLICIIFLINLIICFYKIYLLYILIKGESFSFIPWCNFFIFGLLVSDLLNNTQQEKIKKIILMFLVIIINNLLLWAIFSTMITDSFFLHYLKSISFFVISFAICYYYIDIKNYDTKFSKYLTQWGRIAFSIYYIQFILIIGGRLLIPLIIYELVLFIPVEFLFYLILISIYLILEIIINIWKKFNYIYGIEWLMNQISKKSLFIKKD